LVWDVEFLANAFKRSINVLSIQTWWHAHNTR